MIGAVTLTMAQARTDWRSLITHWLGSECYVVTTVTLPLTEAKRARPGGKDYYFEAQKPQRALRFTKEGGYLRHDLP